MRRWMKPGLASELGTVLWTLAPQKSVRQRTLSAGPEGHEPGNGLVGAFQAQDRERPAELSNPTSRTSARDRKSRLECPVRTLRSTERRSAAVSPRIAVAPSKPTSA
jgi:hypothetical protein